MKRGLAHWEVYVVLGLLAIVVTILLPAKSMFLRGAGSRASCQNSLKMMGQVFKMYASESEKEMYPPLFARTGPTVDCDKDYVPTWSMGLIVPIPDLDVLYGEYISDVGILACPAREEFEVIDRKGPDGKPELLQPCDNPFRGPRLVARSYEYLGWAFDRADCETKFTAGGLTGPRQVVETLEPLLRPWREGKATEADRARLHEHQEVSQGFGIGPQPHDHATVRRLHTGVERFMIMDIIGPDAPAHQRSKVWIMWDRSQIDDGNNYTGFHRPGGSNVLFLDGHVEFMKFENCGPAPVNMPFANFMREAFGE